MRRDFQCSLPHGRFRTEASPMRSVRVLSSPVTYAPPKSLQRTVHTHAKRGQRPNEDQPPRCTARMQLGENLVAVAPPCNAPCVRRRSARSRFLHPLHFVSKKRIKIRDRCEFPMLQRSFFPFSGAFFHFSA